LFLGTGFSSARFLLENGCSGDFPAENVAISSVQKNSRETFETIANSKPTAAQFASPGFEFKAVMRRL